MNFHTQVACDNVFRTCCVLHNWILQFNNKDDRWERQGEWEGSLGQFGSDEMSFFERFQHRLYQGLRSESDFTGIGRGPRNFVVNEEREWYELQRQLVRHFSLQFARNEVEWLS